MGNPPLYAVCTSYIPSTSNVVRQDSPCQRAPLAPQIMQDSLQRTVSANMTCPATQTTFSANGFERNWCRC